MTDNEDNYDEEEEENDNNSNNDSLIEQLLVTKLNDINSLEENKKKCIICMENFVKKDKIITLPCIHIFHKNCIINWLKKKMFVQYINLK